ncbi:MAG: ABC transporter permease [Candidatus Acidiferrales bacterium]
MKFPWSDREQRKEALEEEIAGHLKMAASDREARGESSMQANAAARRELGNKGMIQDVTHDQWGWTWLETLLQDLRYGARTLRKNPGFTMVALLTLALGIGANTAIFSLVNGVLLQPLPYPHPDRLVGLTRYFPKGPLVFMREQSRTMELVGFSDNKEFNLTGSGDPVRLIGNSVSADFLSVLGEQAAMGRIFQKGEDQPGRDNEVILSKALWERRFHSDPNIVGRSITLEGVDRQIVGVMPGDFKFPSPKTELWVPLRLDPRNIGDYWGDSYMALMGRLRPGATVAQARAELKAMRPRVLAAYAWRMPDDSFIDASVVSLGEAIVGDARGKLLILLGAVGLLLLIACANVANLLLARATTREKEVAVRVALGAGRWRILRQLITESVLLSLLGAALGLGVAVYGLSIMKTGLPADTPRLADVALDGHVLIFTAFLAVFTGIIFGLVPALGASRVDMTETLKSSGQRSATRGNHRASRLLVVGEVAISMILVVAAGLLVKSLWILSGTNPGFHSEHLVTARITPNESFCEVPGRCLAFYNELLARVRGLPGVQDVAAVNGLPLGGGAEVFPGAVEAHPTPAGAHVPMLWEKIITPDYLRAMKIPLLRGRAFTDADAAPDAQAVVIVSKATAERFWPGKDAVGEHIRPNWEKDWRTVVGVVGDVREFDIKRDSASWIDGVIYTPYGPHAIRGSGAAAPPAEMTLVIGTSGDQVQIAGELKNVVAELNNEVPVSQVSTMKNWVSEAMAEPRSISGLFAVFAALALLLGSVGIYGVVSYSVAQRTREIGIRMALGARRQEVLMLVVGQGVKLALAGVAIGIAGGLMLTRLMSGLLYGVHASDPVTYSAVALLLMLVALAACFIPARRAMQVDPMVALRYE